MRERVYLNRIKIDYKTDFARAKDYMKRHGIDIDFDFVQSDYKRLSYQEVAYANFKRIHLKPEAASFIPIDTAYDLTSFIFNGEEFPPPNIPTGKCYTVNGHPFMEIGTHTLNPKDLTYIEVLHEHMHAFVRLAKIAGFNIPDVMDSYHLNDQPENRLSNFGMQWKFLEPWVKSLKPREIKKGLKHFTQEEVKGLTEDFKQRLDVGREESGISWVLTSTLRTPEHNKKVGGSPTSAHLDGTGADVRARNWVEVGKIVDGARKAGITGITVYRNSRHVHLDMKPYRLEVK